MESMGSAERAEIVATWIIAAKAIIKNNVGASKAFRRVIQKTRFNADGSKDPSTGHERSRLENERRKLGQVTLWMLVLVSALQGKPLLGRVFATAGNHDVAWYVRLAVSEISRVKKPPRFDFWTWSNGALRDWAKTAMTEGGEPSELPFPLPKIELEQVEHSAAVVSPSEAAAE